MFKRLSELFYGKQHLEAQRPAPTAIPSPLKPHPEPALLTRNWSHPFGDRADPLQQLTHLARAGNGFYPLGVHGSWHAGVHFDGATAGVLDQSRVLCMADGEVVAYRIPSKAPTTRYATVPRPEFEAPFASGFVLVRHRIQAPALDNSDETPPALTFYSLYMHLEDWVAYDGTALQRPGFWVESEKKWVRDDAPDSRPGMGRGVNVKALRTPSATLDFLAAGTEVVISGEGELKQLDSPGPTWLQNADGTLQGYISVSGLGVRSGDLLMIKTRSLNVHAEPGLQGAVLGKLPEGTFVRVSGEGDFLKLDRVVQYVPIKALRSEWVPAQRDAVFIPDKPIPIQAGDLIGHIGIY